jgi:hypothetical protein
MSQNSSDLPETLEEERVEDLLNHADLINDNYDEIEEVFEDVLNSERAPLKWDDFIGTLHTRLYDHLDEPHSVEDLASALLNTVGNWKSDRHEKLKEKDSQLASNLRVLSSKYGLPVTRRAQRINQGQKYWSNIKSSVVIRSNNPVHKHEITIDHDTILEIDSSINGSVILSRHLIQQVAEYPDVIGEDVISSVSRSEVERINDLSEEILELMDEHDDVESSQEFEGTEETSTTSDE